MKIDFYKLVELLTPTFLRKSRLLELFHVFIAKPLQALFVRFHVFREKSKYRAAITPQVCSLVHAIEREFDTACTITELDGKPYDFLLSIEKSVDLNAIRELIDKHKLAGKSYLFELGDTVYSVKWLDHMDENLIERFEARWISYVDEHDGEIKIYVYETIDFDIEAQTAKFEIHAKTKEAVRDDVTIILMIGLSNADSSRTAWQWAYPKILAGSTEALLYENTDTFDIAEWKVAATNWQPADERTSYKAERVDKAMLGLLINGLPDLWA